MHTTIKDVARIAGVSVSTVSNVLNAKPGVHPVLRERVQDVIRRTGYVPSAAARSLVTRKAGCIGFFLARSVRRGLLDSLYDEIIQAVEDELQARGSMMIFSSLAPGALEAEAALRGRIGKIDGVILAGFDTRRELDLLHRSNIPVVLVNRSDPERQVPSVSVDFGGGTREAVSHLVSLGHRRILLIDGPFGNIGSDMRRDGYLKALAQAGIEPDPDLIVDCAWAVEAGIEAVKERLAAGVAFTAICAATDALAYGALVALREAGLRVPEQVSVVGFDDIPNAATMAPPLTTIRADGHGTGRAAVRILFEAPESPAPQVILPAHLVLRASTAPCADYSRIRRRKTG